MTDPATDTYSLLALQQLHHWWVTHSGEERPGWNSGTEPILQKRKTQRQSSNYRPGLPPRETESGPHLKTFFVAPHQF